MAQHYYHGDWHFYYLQVDNNTGQSTWNLNSILTLEDVDGQTGKITKAHDNNGFHYTGQVDIKDGSISFDRIDGAKAHFDGSNVFDKFYSIPKLQVTVLMGTRKPTLLAAKEKRSNLAIQDDGIWVGTKP